MWWSCRIKDDWLWGLYVFALMCLVCLVRGWFWVASLARQRSTSGLWGSLQRVRAPPWPGRTRVSSSWRSVKEDSANFSANLLWCFFNNLLSFCVFHFCCVNLVKRWRKSLKSVEFLGLSEPALVPFCPGLADPIHRHHSHPAGGHLPGRAPPDRHERLPERAAEHAGLIWLKFQFKIIKWQHKEGKENPKEGVLLNKTCLVLHRIHILSIYDYICSKQHYT